MPRICSFYGILIKTSCTRTGTSHALLDYGGVFEPLRDPEYFRQLRADPEVRTIAWPNEADIAPETLYEHARRSAPTPTRRSGDRSREG